MREIKFRAWDHDKKIFGEVTLLESYVGSYQVEQNYGHKGRVSLWNPANEADCGSWGRWIERVDLEQFTGVRDKNGVEIYEGDVVKSVALLNDHNQKGATDNFTVRYFASSFCYCWKDQESGVPIFPFCVSHDIEIIGNIHENKALLAIE